MGLIYKEPGKQLTPEELIEYEKFDGDQLAYTIEIMKRHPELQGALYDWMQQRIKEKELLALITGEQ